MIREIKYTKDFGKRLEQKRDRTGFPRDVIFEITHQCNLRCRHCYVIDARISTDLEARIDTRISTDLDARIDTRISTDLDARIDARISTDLEARIDTRISTDLEARIGTENQCQSVKISANQCNTCNKKISERRELTTSEVKSIFEQLVEAGCLHLTLTGGEPLLRKDIFSLMDYARRIGLFIHLFTNATLISPRTADRLKELNLVSLEISLHSLRKKRFDWFTQVNGSFESMMGAIRLLRERKIKPALKININKENLDEAEGLRRFAEDIGAIPELAGGIMPWYDGSRDNLSLRLSPEEVYGACDIFFQPAAKEKKDPIKASPEVKTPARNWVKGKLFQCGAGKDILAIDPYGELKPCLEFHSSGCRILEYGLKEAWRHLIGYIESSMPSPEYRCFECGLRNFCSSCPARAKLECGDMNSCPDYYRRLAKLGAQRNEDTESGVRRF